MKLGPYEVLEDIPLVKARWLDARLERCRTPSGAVIEDYTVLHFPDWACAAASTADGRLVMTRQWRQGAKAVSLEFAGGVVDPGEDAGQAAARELMEETGYRGVAGRPLLQMNPNPALQRNWFHATLFTDCVRVAEPEAHPTEEVEVEPMTPEAVKAAILSGEMIHALHIATALALIVHLSETA